VSDATFPRTGKLVLEDGEIAQVAVIIAIEITAFGNERLAA